MIATSVFQYIAGVVCAVLFIVSFIGWGSNL